MKVLKYLFELMFVFLLPICFIFISFKYKTINQYDSSGNLISVEKVLDYSDNSILRDYNDNLQYKYIINDFNLWNENWELGTLNWANGSPSSNNSFIRSIDYIEINSNTSYCIVGGDKGVVLYEYDINYNFISRFNQILPNTYSVVTTSENAKYFRFRSYNETTIYNGDICINLSVTWANGNYVSFGEPLIIYSNDNYLNGYSIKEINYTWYSKFFNNFFNELQFNHNSFAKLIIIYLVMTIVFFFFWNLIYWPLSLLFRLLLWKKTYY